MPLFEVFIPTNEADGFDITARIRADSWVQALRNGLSRLGDGADVRNVMCDIKEDCIDVTEPNTGRVFRIRELAEEAAAPAAPVPDPAVAAPVAAAQPPPPAVHAAPPPAVKPAPIVPRPAEASAPKPAMPAPLIPGAGRFQGGVEEENVKRERPTGAPQAIGRKAVEPSCSVEDLLAELFEATTQLYEHRDVQAAANFILDLAMKSVPADAGSVFIADINGDDLYFAAARGPKAQEVMKFRVPIGQGIVGFCAQEGVSVAVSDVQRDPRFFAAISKRIGYDTHSILCAPSQLDGRVFGALQLINKKGGATFSGDEMSALDYLSRQFAEYLVNTGQTGS